MPEGRGPWQPPPSRGSGGGPPRKAAPKPAAPKQAASRAPTRDWGAKAGGGAYRIPRSQQWVFAVLVITVVAMAVELLRLRERAAERFAAATQPLPLSAAGGAEQELRLYLARDADGTLGEKPVRFPLPADRNARARTVLGRLLEEYTATNSPHPLHPSAGVEEVFLLPVPGGRAKGARLAVVNLAASFAQNHPSGIEPESLTLLSMIATLHANLPEVAEVRFLVDGERRATLAGHADLLRAYLTAGTDMNDQTEGAPQ